MHWDKLSNHYDELKYKKKKGANHDIGIVPEYIVPSEDEVRFLGNRNKNCEYYKIFGEVCHAQ